jgi:hypothetical protein
MNQPAIRFAPSAWRTTTSRHDAALAGPAELVACWDDDAQNLAAFAATFASVEQGGPPQLDDRNRLVVSAAVHDETRWVWPVRHGRIFCAPSRASRR